MFAEVLKSTIANSGASISKLSRESGISRSLLHKVINGETEMNQTKFDCLIAVDCFDEEEKNKLIRAYLSNREYSHIYHVNLRIQKFIDQVNNFDQVPTGLPEQLEPRLDYKMFNDRDEIRKIVFGEISGCQQRILILNEESSDVESYLPANGENIIQIKNINSTEKKTNYLNSMLAAYLKNENYQGYYTVDPTINLSVYDNYVLVDDKLLMYDNEMNNLGYTTNPKRIEFFKNVFFKRLDRANQYFRVQHRGKGFVNEMDISPEASFVSDESNYYIAKGNCLIHLDTQFQNDLKEYFGKGDIYVKVCK